VTCSIGIGVQGEEYDFANTDELVGAADRALYGAKFGGRDQVVMYSENLSPLS
jgi:PleD family two-component response regulator